MTTHSRRHLSSVSASVALAGLLILASPARAQTPAAAIDPRWQAWHGCWQPMADPVTGVNTAPFSQVCVVPGARATTADLITIADGRVASREPLDVSGQRRATEQDGCAGWEQAEWSADGRRLYRRSEFQCANGVKRTTSGLFAMTASGDWLDVMSATSADSTGVRVMHYRPSFMINTALPADAQSALQQRGGLMSDPLAPLLARTAASAPATTREVTDVSTHTTAGVTQAWLSELAQPFQISAGELVALKDAGVSDRVTDLLVALAYPNTFGLRHGPSPAAAANTAAAGGAGPLALADCRLNPGYFSNTCGLYNPFMYGYGPYGYGYNYYGAGPYSYRPYGTWYSGAEPVVIVVGGGGNGGTASGATHGQVSRTRGYVEGRTEAPPSPAASSNSSPSSAPASSSSSSGGSGGGSSPAPSPSGGERTAQPR